MQRRGFEQKYPISRGGGGVNHHPGGWKENTVWECQPRGQLRTCLGLPGGAVGSVVCLKVDPLC